MCSIASIADLCPVTNTIMTSRIEENGIKAVIYFLLFVTLIFKSLFLQPSVEQAQTLQKSQGVVIPANSR